MITSATPLRPFAARDADGEVLSMQDFETRCGWMLDLAQEVGTRTLPPWWTPASLDALASGIDGNGKKLPPSGHVAASRLGWVLDLPADLHVPDRFKRGVAVRLMALMRAKAEQAALYEALLPHLGTIGELDLPAVRAVPAASFAPRRTLEHLAQSAWKAWKRDGCLPPHLALLHPVPVLERPAFPFSACDDHLVGVEVNSDQIKLKLKLPLVERPTRNKDWGWTTALFRIPEFRQAQAITKWCLPTMRHDGRKLLFDFASEEPDVLERDQTRAIGVDWSPGSLCVGALTWLDGQKPVSDGLPLAFDDQGWLSKTLRLQSEEGHLRRKLRHHDRLGMLPNVVKTENAESLSRKRGNLNRALAWKGANFLVDQALHSNVGVIAFEDLRDLDTDGRGAFQNNRSAQSVRGLIYAATEHLARRYGITVLQVPARGTSALCPGCNAEVSRPQGHFSMACTCGLEGDRDVAAAINIAKRALLAIREGVVSRSRKAGQTRRAKKTLHRDVQIIPSTPKSAAKTKARPTRSRRLPPRTRSKANQKKTNQKKTNQKKTNQKKIGPLKTVVPKKVPPARASLWAKVKRTPLRVVSTPGRGMNLILLEPVTDGLQERMSGFI